MPKYCITVYYTCKDCPIYASRHNIFSLCMKCKGMQFCACYNDKIYEKKIDLDFVGLS